MNSLPEDKLRKIMDVQSLLASRVVERPLPLEDVRTVGAVDVSYRGDRAKSAFVLCSFPDCDVLDVNVVETDVPFDYVPTLFFLRETRPVLMAVNGKAPDVLIVEGHGRAHPRGYGLACHIGLLTGLPTIGVAKRPLKGVPEDAFLRLGKAYVSVGNLIDQESAGRIVRGLLVDGYPGPLRIADRASKGRGV